MATMTVVATAATIATTIDPLTHPNANGALGRRFYFACRTPVSDSIAVAMTGRRIGQCMDAFLDVYLETPRGPCQRTGIQDQHDGDDGGRYPPAAAWCR